VTITVGSGRGRWPVATQSTNNRSIEIHVDNTLCTASKLLHKNKNAGTLVSIAVLTGKSLDQIIYNVSVVFENIHFAHRTSAVFEQPRIDADLVEFVSLKSKNNKFHLGKEDYNSICCVTLNTCMGAA
jgi:hypothetical protein